MVTQITNRELSVDGGQLRGRRAQFENIGSLKPGAAVSMAGVTVGRVDSISFDQNVYKAVVKMRIASSFNRIPSDSDAAIMTSGLLGGQYIGITAGGAEEFLKSRRSHRAGAGCAGAGEPDQSAGRQLHEQA